MWLYPTILDGWFGLIIHQNHDTVPPLRDTGDTGPQINSVNTYDRLVISLGHKTGGSTKAPHTAAGHWGSELNILNLRLLSHLVIFLHPYPLFSLSTAGAVIPVFFFWLLAVTDSCTASLWPNKSHILNHIHHFPLWGRGGSGWIEGVMEEESRKGGKSSPDENPKSACLAAAAEA